jgi:hypothetical protein
MKDELESRLNSALREVTPPAELTERIMVRLEARRRGARSLLPWAAAAGLISATIAVGLVVRHQAGEKDAAAGLAARQEVLKALRVTDQKLDLAYQAVHLEQSAPADTAGE